MKKILSLAILLGSFALLNAQTQIGFLYEGYAYQNGDTMVVTIDPDGGHCAAVSFRNQTASVIRDLVVTLTEVEQNGVEVWGLCMGDQCIPALTSTPITLTPNAEYSDFTMDYTANTEIANPYGIYNMQISNGTITCSVLLRLNGYTETIGIGTAAAATTVKAYPNPAHQQVAISYDLSQPSTLVIYNALGQLVSSQAVAGNGTAVISDLPAGLYAYGISGQKMQKLIVR